MDDDANSQAAPPAQWGWHLPFGLGKMNYTSLAPPPTAMWPQAPPVTGAPANPDGSQISPPILPAAQQQPGTKWGWHLPFGLGGMNYTPMQPSPTAASPTAIPQSQAPAAAAPQPGANRAAPTAANPALMNYMQMLGLGGNQQNPQVAMPPMAMPQGQQPQYAQGNPALIQGMANAKGIGTTIANIAKEAAGA